MIWKLSRACYDLAERGMIMGIVNVTPDSMFDGGAYLDAGRAVDRALQLVADGAEIIDVGGESSRPGALSISEEEEMGRVIPVIRQLRAQSDVTISVDTTKARVAVEALEAGADILNDISAMEGDAGMVRAVAGSSCGVVLMHRQGVPLSMQDSPTYEDVVAEVGGYLKRRVEVAVESGIAFERLVVDPGIGFGKAQEHNRDLLRNLACLGAIGRPILIGVSQKTFLGWATGSKQMSDRFWPGVALTSFCRERGGRIFRVHEARPHWEALRMTEAILEKAEIF